MRSRMFISHELYQEPIAGDRLPAPVLLFAEVILIHALDNVADDLGYADAMVNHQLRQLLAINEYDLHTNVAYIPVGFI